MKKILVLIGTRPNFIKVTQFRKMAHKNQVDIRFAHTGQHYDYQMSGVFFEQFGLAPDHFLEIPRGISPNQQIAKIILALDHFVEEHFQPDLMVVLGDVNSTLAGALFANKRKIKLAHVESGLRSRDRGMPEEINRIITDEIADYLFVTEQSGYDNLLAEGKKEEQLFFVGNTMIDTLVAFEPQIEQSPIMEQVPVASQEFVLMTMHRPANVDDKENLMRLVELIALICQKVHLVFPIHPRTMHRLEKFELKDQLQVIENLTMLPPVGYFEFQKLIKESMVVITDSGGIQEETTFRQIPCLTLRRSTERPSTTSIGSNTLVPFDNEVITSYLDQIMQGVYKQGEIPPHWDGKGSERIFEHLTNSILQ